MEPWTWRLKPGSRNVPPWCSVFHQSTEKCTIGTSIAIRSAATAQRRARIVRVGGHTAQGQVAELEQQQQRGRGQPGVPGPPHAPHRPAPQRPGDRASAPRRRRRPRRPRRPAGPRRTSASAATDREGCRTARHAAGPVERDRGHGRVDVEQPSQVALHLVRRGDPQPQPDGEGDGDDGPDADDGEPTRAPGRPARGLRARCSRWCSCRLLERSVQHDADDR